MVTQVQKILWQVCTLLALAGCQSMPNSSPAQEYTPPELDYSLPETTSGGLFRAGYTSSLLRDQRAIRAGDILTVVLNEATQSSKSAGTSFDKSAEIGIEIPSLFGKAVPDANTSAEGSREFSGSARSSQQNTLLGFIAVTVHKVLPNGTLLIKGEKTLHLNQGDEFIRLSGLVRIDDIDTNNYISSQQIANAVISYSGEGALNDSNRAGWLTRFFNHPIFPI